MSSKLFIGLVIVIFAVLSTAIFKMRQAGPEIVRDADQFNIPVIEQAMSKLSSWDFKDLEPFLGERFLELLATDENLQKDLDEISILGDVISFSTPRHVSHKSYDHWLYGKCAVNRYSVSTKFEKGKGSIKFKLNHCYEDVEIIFMQVVSRHLPTKSPALQ